MNIMPRSTCALDGNHNPSCTPLKAAETIYRDPCKSSRSESSTQQKLKTCLFTLPPYGTVSTLTESGNLRLQWLQSCAQGHSEGKGLGTPTARKAGPGKGHTVSVPPGSGLSTPHCAPRMDGGRPGGG